MKLLLVLALLLFFIKPARSQQTVIPDPNFETALINRGYDTLPVDGYVPTANIEAVTQLFIGDEGITDLTGIEDFSALHILICYYNYLEALDLSQNTNLVTLRCYNNQLISLVHANNSHMEILDCSDNELTSLDISGAINLEELYAGNNDLTSIDVSNNTELRKLSILLNDIDSINVSSNQELWLLNTFGNQITNLDVSNNTLLTHLLCNNDQLESLNIKNGNNINFTMFEATNNPNLYCIQVDNDDWAEENWSDYVDLQVIFSEDCGTVGVNKYFHDNIKIYPSPSSGNFIIEIGQLNEVSMKVYNVFGQLISEKKIIIGPSHHFIVQGSPGIYFLELKYQSKLLYYNIVKR